MSEAALPPVLSEFRAVQVHRGGRPPNPGHAIARANRIAFRSLPAVLQLLADTVRDERATLALRLQAAYYLADRCLGKPTVQVTADITSKSLVITPAELAAEIHRLQLDAHAVLQAQDTANQLPQPAPLDTATTSE